MRRTLTALPLALVMAVAPIVVVPAGAQSSVAAPGAARTLVHDELGRLEAVIDPSQGVAIYRYDAVGNIVAIERPELTDVSVIEVWPDRGEPGDAITIQGTAFGADAGSNQVTIGGVPATIDSASATTIVARIPESATDGPVVVTTPTGSATSDEAFAVGSLVPVIDSVSPLIIKAGDTVTVTGTGFGPGPHDADVVVGGTHARVDATADTTLSAYLPREAGSGAVSVSTPWGEVAGPDVFILPDPYTSDQVATTARAELGVATPVSVPAGKVGLLLVQGHAGERLRIAGVSGSMPGLVYDWRNHPVPAPLISGETSQTAPLAQSGTYMVVLDGVSSTTDAAATLTVTTIADAEATMTVDGPEAVITLTDAWQHAKFLFAAQAGETVVIVGGDSNISGQATLLDPFGIPVAHGGYTGLISGPTELTVDGSYTLDIDPVGAGAGRLAVTVSSVAEPTSTVIAPDGSPLALTVDRPGQAAHATFDAVAGTRMSLVWTAGSGCLDLTLLGPEATGWVAGWSQCDGAEWFMEPLTLPATGSYDIAVTGSGASTGDSVLRLYQVPGDLQGP